MPAVLKRSTQDFLDASISSRIVVCIWANSAATNSAPRSVSPWYLARMACASAARSFVMSHRGLSGKKLFGRPNGQHLIKLSAYGWGQGRNAQDEGELQ